MESLWEQTSEHTGFGHLEQDAKTEVLIIGGGIGNLIDRIFRTFVVDYIHVKFVKFAIFNFADCCVVVGTILFIFYFLFLEGKRIKKHDQTQEIDTSKQKEA